MEFSERRRSRKSQSFKLVNEEDFEAEYFGSAETADVNGEVKSVTMPEAWLGDEGVEIKRQITGMMRLLNDKAGRMYQRAQVSGQYGTRSKTLRMLGTAKGVAKVNDAVPPMTSAAEPSCCMCNCKTTLQAILQELRTMRKLMQTQKGPQEKQRIQGSISPARPPGPRKRPRKRRPVHRPEVQLAEDYDVYIPKSQLDSILVNYTRSGSLLFRKLVCAFFDDTTLANSLPNGKRKRGLNDNRKGLDQNIVGAIRAFTEKYCTANRIERLPGPETGCRSCRIRSSWPGDAEAADCDETFSRPSVKTEEFHCSEDGRERALPPTGGDFEKPAEDCHVTTEEDALA
ncbi:hypothetical protein ANANG_G00311920 [Anguilla anguilla]|uniref:BEN domain-containing protein n=1 Tax=Anguilla anguilla TaxID=7936 RepID=A0A9D3LH82_ANGAN|nr:hypothetical protein ANANG_G00311920 [Anguilla anguilla]